MCNYCDFVTSANFNISKFQLYITIATLSQLQLSKLRLIYHNFTCICNSCDYHNCHFVQLLYISQLQLFIFHQCDLMSYIFKFTHHNCDSLYFSNVFVAHNCELISQCNLTSNKGDFISYNVTIFLIITNTADG